MSSSAELLIYLGVLGVMPGRHGGGFGAHGSGHAGHGGGHGGGHDAGGVHH